MIGRRARRGLVGRFPHVRTVLEEFYERRASRTVEAMIEQMKKGDR